MTMPAYTIVTTSATEGSEAAEVNTLTDDFADQSEAVGYSRRMAEEMIGMAGQLLLDFDYTNVALYDGDLLEEELEPEHPAFLGMWVLDNEGAAFVSAEDFLAEDAVVEPA
jgi:hypothetical protein